MRKKISFSKPFVGEEEIKAVSKVIKSGWITTSKVSEKFEKKFASYVGAKHCILLTSCTAALHLSLEYMKRFKLKNRFRVLVPSLTFAATATEVINSGGDLLFGDVDKDTMCLKKPLISNYDVAIPVHLTGVKANTNYACPVIEDSAHLIERNQLKNNSNLVCYSFFATKNLTMGEGGAICTNDSKAALWFKQARHHGISKDGWNRYQDKNKWEYNIDFVGWKYNPSDILAAVGIEQLKKFDIMQAERQRCVSLYNKLLGYNNKGLHLYPILVNNRRKFIKIMEKNKISCSVHFLPLHQMPIFKNKNRMSLSHTEYFGKRLVSLPLFPGLKNKEIKYICEQVLKTKLLIKK